MKNRAGILTGKLGLNVVPKRPWQHILVDFITNLPVSKDHNSTIEKTIAERLTRLFRNNM